MQSPYSLVSKVLFNHRVFFSVDGRERHKPSDIILFDDAVAIEPYAAFLAGNHLFSMGSFSYSWSTLPIDTFIGRYCSIARGVGVMGNRHPYERISSSSFTYDPRFVIFKQANEDFIGNFQVVRQTATNKPMEIGHDVWIGANTILKRGITIGTGSVIAGNSVVTKDVPPYSIVGGNPAKVIKSRFPEELVADLLTSHWWDYKFTDFRELNIKDPTDFLAGLKELVRDGIILPYQPQALTRSILSAGPLE